MYVLYINQAISFIVRIAKTFVITGPINLVHCWKTVRRPIFVNVYVIRTPTGGELLIIAHLLILLRLQFVFKINSFTFYYIFVGT